MKFANTENEWNGNAIQQWRGAENGVQKKCDAKNPIENKENELL